MEVVFPINLNIRNMNKKVSEFVRKYIEEHLDKSDSKPEYDVYVVWYCYILGNAKWLLSTTLPDEKTPLDTERVGVMYCFHRCDVNKN